MVRLDAQLLRAAPAFSFRDEWQDSQAFQAGALACRSVCLSSRGTRGVLQGAWCSSERSLDPTAQCSSGTCPLRCFRLTSSRTARTCGLEPPLAAIVDGRPTGLASGLLL